VKPLLAITMGDPVGIGPEVILKAATVNDVRGDASLVVYGDPRVLYRATTDNAIPMKIIEVERPEEAVEVTGERELAVIAISRIDPSTFGWGRPNEESDRVQVAYIEAAFEAVEKKRAAALVTAPISKASLRRAGAPWPGHTEMLADLAGVERPVMMLAGPTLKVVPLTVHVPLSAVPSALSVDKILHAVRVTDESFRRYFGRRRPRIAVAGLNPHAGEQGLFGNEERLFIEPAIARAKEEGIDATGPFAADTVFYRAVSGAFDVVIGMYHDQALIPIKLLDFDSAVNVTLGLPLIRTSVDHGTAYDIAGKGVATATSMIQALRLATRMADQHEHP
jgi:4-hydroxythreonine-4-phosphate dehydrogenase